MIWDSQYIIENNATAHIGVIVWNGLCGWCCHGNKKPLSANGQLRGGENVAVLSSMQSKGLYLSETAKYRHSGLVMG